MKKGNFGEQAIFLWIFRHPHRSSNIRTDLQTSAQIFKTSAQISKHLHGSSNTRTDLQTSTRVFKTSALTAEALSNSADYGKRWPTR